MNLQKYLNKKIAILGFGREGASSLRFLLQHGINPEFITILDENTQISIPQGVNSRLGSDYQDTLEEFDIIFKTPGKSLYDPAVYKVKEKITSQTQLFFDNYKGKVIAISGTKGKSTTSTLIYLLLRNNGFTVALLGNIGTPLLDEIDFENPYDFVVLELSSYMLEGLHKQNYLSILGNIYPEHLDWHNGFENYKNAKLGLLTGAQHKIIESNTYYNYVENKDSQDIIYGQVGNVYFKDGEFFVEGKKVFDDKGIQLLGEHNRINMCAAIAVSVYLGLNLQTCLNTLNSFTGLPHRLEYVGNYNGIDFYDDAISTTPQSTIQAIEIFKERIGTIFLGGTDRGYDFHELVEVLKKYSIKNIVLFPPSGDRIKELLDNSFTILETTSMQEAVNFGFEHTVEGKVCLLSCASPGYSIWKNFEEKGDLFQHYVKNH